MSAIAALADDSVERKNRLSVLTILDSAGEIPGMLVVLGRDPRMKALSLARNGEIWWLTSVGLDSGATGGRRG